MVDTNTLLWVKIMYNIGQIPPAQYEWMKSDDELS